MNDPFGTGLIRERVLDGWTAAAVRFREDANAEEDLALGGYRDRVLVELAQNAADAAARAGVPGRLLLALQDLPDGPALVAANTGAALDVEGVEALATLRASAKRGEDPSVGRFGVGFSAVLAVADEPALLSRTGGVRFSASDTRALVTERAAASGALAEELHRRDGHVPVLRLPFPAQGEPPVGYDTAVVLPLRDESARDLVVRLLRGLDDTLLLALPALDEVRVDGPDAVHPRTLAGVAGRWHVLRRSGRLDPALLADRPTEERRRTTWSLTWALPAGDGATLPDVVHAPTPTDEPLPWPALLLASFPLDPDRRNVAPGPATDALVAEAARAYADLLAERAAAGDAQTWRLVPTGLPAGRLDAALREAAIAALGHARILRAAEQPDGAEPDGAEQPDGAEPDGAEQPDGAEPDGATLRPRDAVVLDLPAGADARVVGALAPAVAGLVLAPRAARPAFDVLGVRTLPLADLVEQLPAGRDPGRWRALYDAFGELGGDPLVREALAALPIPLADGRAVRGARGVLIPANEQVARALAALGARVVDPQAAGPSGTHPLLERLGAQPVGAREALALPEVAVVVEQSLDRREDGDVAPLDAVLDLVAAALDGGPDALDAVPDLGDLGDLALLDEDGEPAPARELALPGSPAREVLDEDAVGTVDGAFVERWGRAVLRAVGVLDGLAVVRAADVALLGDDLPDVLDALPDLDDWVDAALVTAGVDAADALEVTCHELVAVRDLDAVRDGAWARVLAGLAAHPDTRAALLDPARLTVRTARGARTIDVPPWTAWWLRRELLDGRAWADPDADPDASALLGGPADASLGLAALDPAVRRALGALGRLDDLDDGAVEGLLARLADEDVAVEVPAALAVWAGLAALAASGGAGRLDDVDPPSRVRALRLDGDPATGGGPRTVVVDAADAVVADGPAWLQRADVGALVVAGAHASALADLLDLPLASEVAAGLVEESTGVRCAVPEAVRAVLPGAPDVWCEHEALAVDGHEVDWWLDAAGLAHAATLDGLARALAWAAGRWDRRFAAAAALAEPGTVTAIRVDDAF